MPCLISHQRAHLLAEYFPSFFQEVVEWELAAKGKFFSDEVYIILNCAKNTTVGMIRSLPEALANFLSLRLKIHSR